MVRRCAFFTIGHIKDILMLMSNYQNCKSILILLRFHGHSPWSLNREAELSLMIVMPPQMQYPFWTLGCAVEPFPGACSKSDSGVLFGSWLAQYPPGSGTKAQLCRKRLQFPPRCVTNALLCLLPKPQPHGTQRSAGIFPLTKTHKQCSSSSLLSKLELYLCCDGFHEWASFTAPVTVYGDS